MVHFTCHKESRCDASEIDARADLCGRASEHHSVACGHGTTGNATVRAEPGLSPDPSISAARQPSLSASLDLDRPDNDLFQRAVALVRRRTADLPDDVHAVDDFAKNGVPIVEMRCGTECDEELTTVGVRAAVGHRENPGFVVAQLRMKLVGKRIAGPADPLSQGIPALNHEAIDHPMEDDAVIVGPGDGLIGARIFPLLGAFRQSHKVLNRFRRLLIEQTCGEISFTRDELRV